MSTIYIRPGRMGEQRVRERPSPASDIALPSLLGVSGTGLSYPRLYTNQIHNDARNRSAGGLDQKAKKLLAIIETYRHRSPPRFKRLVVNSPSGGMETTRAKGVHYNYE